MGSYELLLVSQRSVAAVDLGAEDVVVRLLVHPDGLQRLTVHAPVLRNALRDPEGVISHPSIGSAVDGYAGQPPVPDGHLPKLARPLGALRVAVDEAVP